MNPAKRNKRLVRKSTDKAKCREKHSLPEGNWLKSFSMLRQASSSFFTHTPQTVSNIHCIQVKDDAAFSLYALAHRPEASLVINQD